MAETNISWAEHSINPVRARDKNTGAAGHFCEKISTGCRFCYASAMQGRFGMHEYLATNRDKVELFLDEHALKSVLARKKPTRYFWCTMTDLFWSAIPDAWIDRCFATMALTPRHTHLVLTKRAERMREYFSEGRSGSWGTPAFEMAKAIGWVVSPMDEKWLPVRERIINPPLPNVWLGCSVENQEWADRRIPHLLATPAAVRFLSVEPLLGPVRLGNWIARDCPSCGGTGPDAPGPTSADPECGRCGGRGSPPSGLHWVIVGAESGPDRRPAEVKWFADVVRQCDDASVAVFVKQDGAHKPGQQGRLPDELWCRKELPQTRRA